MATGYVGVTEAARRLGVHSDTIVRWCDQNTIGHLRTPGGHRRIDEAAIEALRSRGQQSGLANKPVADLVVALGDVVAGLEAALVDDDVDADVALDASLRIGSADTGYVRDLIRIATDLHQLSTVETHDADVAAGGVHNADSVTSNAVKAVLAMDLPVRRSPQPATPPSPTAHDRSAATPAAASAADTDTSVDRAAAGVFDAAAAMDVIDAMPDPEDLDDLDGADRPAWPPPVASATGPGADDELDSVADEPDPPLTDRVDRLLEDLRDSR